MTAGAFVDVVPNVVGRFLFWEEASLFRAREIEAAEVLQRLFQERPIDRDFEALSRAEPDTGLDEAFVDTVLALEADVHHRSWGVGQVVPRDLASAGAAMNKARRDGMIQCVPEPRLAGHGQMLAR